MSNLISWSDELSVHVAAFDAEHRRLVATINELNEAMRVGHGRDVVGKILGELVDYTKTHFAHEEKAFAQHAYPDAANHKREHEALIRQVGEFQQKFQQGRAMLSVELMHFLTDWLKKHIQSSDKHYGPFLNEKGVH